MPYTYDQAGAKGVAEVSLHSRIGAPNRRGYSLTGPLVEPDRTVSPQCSQTSSLTSKDQIHKVLPNQRSLNTAAKHTHYASI